MQISEINEHLYLCAARAMKPERLRRLGITSILNCTKDIPPLKLPDTECLQILVDDMVTSRLGPYFDKCADKVHEVNEKGGKTVVHCFAGVSRSATICIAYLMKYQAMTLKDAYQHVKVKRRIINPNYGFWRQLIEYEKQLLGKNTVKMHGLIPDVYKY